MSPSTEHETRMLVNYTPGEACRVAIEENGKLHELHAEHMTAVSRVGNIYVGRVHNVEESIQAAFVDFGIGINGFLHVSDVHPRYFPGDDDATERVGKKTPRRERPPIQRSFKRGQEVIVQVLKEGVGSKGPTLTSYLSIPGRYLVMMPNMDKVGVSRNVEDEDERRRMRKILDALDLPKEFGFILRTAGFERTKTELKRDLSYLQRLWKDMEARRKKGKKPRLLYSESDLLLRSLRDHLGTETKEVVIDSELAIRRAARFMKIVAPRSTAKLKRYTGSAPIFHAFGIEPQIDEMHAREVPLPSGGRLVIDETEALVAIDVNSGRSRSARDAETNAYKTNMEAADEICRQLRLRDLGGLVINDLIDMRDKKHRKSVEQRFKDLLKNDRAKSTILPISEFGILEMTRQRMRGSHEQQHFAPCPLCHERGLIQKPPSVAAQALRDVEALLQHSKIERVELVVSARVAGDLLSARRRTIGRIERDTGKRIDVRISDAISIDRFALYAYDGSGSDVELERLGRQRFDRSVVDWKEAAADGEDWAQDLGLEAEEAEQAAIEGETLEEELQPFEKDADEPAPRMDDDDEDEEGAPRKKRRRRGRRRGRGRGRSEDDAGVDESGEAESQAERDTGRDSDEDTEASDEEARDDETRDDDGEPRKKRRRRRGRRRGRGRGEGEEGQDREEVPMSDADEADDGDADDEAVDEVGEHDDTPRAARGRKKTRRGRSRKATPDADDQPAEAAADDDEAEHEAVDEVDDASEGESVSDEKPKSRRRGRRGRGGRGRSGRSGSDDADADADADRSSDDRPRERSDGRGDDRGKAGGRAEGKAPSERSSRSRRGSKTEAVATAEPKPNESKPSEGGAGNGSAKPVVKKPAAKKKVRALYGRGRRKLGPGD
ncbi:MAG: Rne/Rng family ribonuclease [Planctomycetota bacterium]